MVDMSQQIWMKQPYVSISRVGGTEMQFRSRSSSLRITGDNFDIEGVETFGGKVTRIGSREDIEITMDIFPISAEKDDFDALFYGHTGSSAIITSSDQLKHRICLLWTNESGITSGAEAIASGSDGYRRIYAEGYITNMEPSQDAGEDLKGTITYKTSPVDEDGSSNRKIESCTQGGTPETLSAVASYDTSTKW